MDDDETKILRWLESGGRVITVSVWNGQEFEEIEQHLEEKNARDALVKLLRSKEPLNWNIREALADGFEQIGSSKVRLELKLRTRGGRPKKTVQETIEEVVKELPGLLALANKIEASVEGQPKRSLAISEAAKREGVTRTKAYEVLKLKQLLESVRGK